MLAPENRRHNVHVSHYVATVPILLAFELPLWIIACLPLPASLVTFLNYAVVCLNGIGHVCKVAYDLDEFSQKGRMWLHRTSHVTGTLTAVMAFLLLFFSPWRGNFGGVLSAFVFPLLPGLVARIYLSPTLALPRSVVLFSWSCCFDKACDCDPCSICLDKFFIAESCVELNCKHKFHEDCFRLRYISNHTCPLCRAST